MYSGLNIKANTWGIVNVRGKLFWCFQWTCQVSVINFRQKLLLSQYLYPNGHFSYPPISVKQCLVTGRFTNLAQALSCFVAILHIIIGEAGKTVCAEKLYFGYYCLYALCIADSKGTMLLLVIFSGAMLITKDSPMHTKLSVSTFQTEFKKNKR